IARGFNLGVDFAGGSLYYLQFVTTPDTNRMRAALTEQGVDTQKVIIQPISAGGRTAGGQGLLVRLPKEAGGNQAASDGDIGGQKRTVLRALSTFNADQTGGVGKLDVNTTDE